MGFEYISYEDVAADYKELILGSRGYLIPFSEIANFGFETEHFNFVYRLIQKNQQRCVVIPIKNKSELLKITDKWADKEAGRY
ncbi:MAG TPA: hypothetical protein VJH65_02345 [Candidatus Nanoarchaeia archaeon]|nr:hypothetical protein [Candidatus Nanoarchaeia archaeon]